MSGKYNVIIACTNADYSLKGIINCLIITRN
jgi:hypothetical protein